MKRRDLLLSARRRRRETSAACVAGAGRRRSPCGASAAFARGARRSAYSFFCVVAAESVDAASDSTLFAAFAAGEGVEEKSSARGNSARACAKSVPRKGTMRSSSKESGAASARGASARSRGVVERGATGSIEKVGGATQLAARPLDKAAQKKGTMRSSSKESAASGRGTSASSRSCVAPQHPGWIEKVVAATQLAARPLDKAAQKKGTMRSSSKERAASVRGMSASSRSCVSPRHAGSIEKVVAATQLAARPLDKAAQKKGTMRSSTEDGETMEQREPVMSSRGSRRLSPGDARACVSGSDRAQSYTCLAARCSSSRGARLELSTSVSAHGARSMKKDRRATQLAARPLDKAAQKKGTIRSLTQEEGPMEHREGIASSQPTGCSSREAIEEKSLGVKQLAMPSAR